MRNIKKSIRSGLAALVVGAAMGTAAIAPISVFAEDSGETTGTQTITDGQSGEMTITANVIDDRPAKSKNSNINTGVQSENSLYFAVLSAAAGTAIILCEKKKADDSI